MKQSKQFSFRETSFLFKEIFIKNEQATAPKLASVSFNFENIKAICASSKQSGPYRATVIIFNSDLPAIAEKTSPRTPGHKTKKSNNARINATSRAEKVFSVLSSIKCLFYRERKVNVLRYKLYSALIKN